ncbi:hypothetical protein TNIN_228731 [Trichonephila inaurata madagascariensis]|uniref:C2H2-type domain-containing protein n=1 Tax=Trichonephila inaurata madagascariensis TaxID=2747483 RepID=A0A8X6XJY2_9ARAC|nr:hypothetical protein TNIN_228731 [Trichonephila inaurata madagascariensis]
MSAERSGGSTEYGCDTCHRTFQFRRHYLMQVHKETFSHNCFQCAAAFNSSLEFLDHFKNHVQDLDLNSMYCSESFSSRDTLRLHQNNRKRKNLLFAKWTRGNLTPKDPNMYCYMGLKDLLILECAI